nr:MAG TPA: holin protein [Caudoviricetes sp.]
MSHTVELVITIFGSVLTSTGLWAYLQKRAERHDAKTQLMLGLAHNQIVAMGTAYLSRGYITIDEFEDLQKYLYQPYHTFGGNGTAEKVMDAVNRLPIHFPDTRRKDKRYVAVESDLQHSEVDCSDPASCPRNPVSRPGGFVGVPSH